MSQRDDFDLAEDVECKARALAWRNMRQPGDDEVAEYGPVVPGRCQMIGLTDRCGAPAQLLITAAGPRWICEAHHDLYAQMRGGRRFELAPQKKGEQP